MKYRAKVTKGGKISLPAAFRKHLNLQNGDEILFESREGEIVFFPVKSMLEKVRKNINHYHPSNESLVDKLIAERRKEAKDE
jgi:AbrB family looped-hinge helix DNA binding protein